MEGTQAQTPQPTSQGGSMPPVSLTAKAIAMVKQEMDKANLQGYALRVGVTGGGCSGYQYDLDFSNEVRAGDLLLEQDGLKIVVDERSAHYLRGTTIDYVEQLGVSGFKFMNPNAQKTCGCGSSFSA